MRKIIESVDYVLEFLVQIPLSTNTIRAYRHCYKRIIIYCHDREMHTFTDKEADCFMKAQLLRMENGEIRPQHFRLQRRAATLLADQMHDRELCSTVRRYNSKALSEKSKVTLTEFASVLSKTLSPGTIRITLGIVKQFLFFLEENKVYNFSKLKQEHVNDFTTIVAPKHKSSMATLTRSIKKFLIFLKDIDAMKSDVEIHLITPASRRSRLLPCFTDIEINSIFAVVDTESAMGKRDYAIMKLALGTGLRSVDIFSLKLLDIDWEKNEINILQSKTNVYLQLPLQNDIGNAIADYILHARPRSDSPYVFLRILKPHDQMSASQAGRNIIVKYLTKAGISLEAWDGKKFHALRRTTGTRLIRAGLPIESVSEILGQKSVESSKRYIALNNDELRSCCLNISEYKTHKEGLV